MEIKEFAPVIIPTLNRYEHFKRCIESLELCTWADKTDVYIGLDYPPAEKYFGGWKKIDEYLRIKTLKFNKITVYRHEKNLGPIGNLRFLKKMIGSNYKCYIATEDDNEFSPCFLDFMNKILLKYENDANVTSVAGYTPHRWYNKSCGTVLLTHDFSAWGYGIWLDKKGAILPEKSYYTDIMNSWNKSLKLAFLSFRMFCGLFEMLYKNKIWGDTMRFTYNIMENKYQIRPTISIVKNWGNDGSGVNCRNLKQTYQQEISKSSFYDICDYDLSNKRLYISISNETIYESIVRFPKRFGKFLFYVMFRIRGKHL